jgi:hypothetical protein
MTYEMHESLEYSEWGFLFPCLVVFVKCEVLKIGLIKTGLVFFL